MICNDVSPHDAGRAEAWPKATVSPTQASGLLNCDPYSLNVAAKAGRLAIRHIFSGRNLRISKTDLLAFCTGSTEGAWRVCK